jgi:FtsP/CotA-like multicopper oxidase with cupredoxin domain
MQVRILSAVLAVLFLSLCATVYAQVTEHPPQTHTYYIAAEEVEWDYTPLGRNLAGTPDVELAEGSATRGHRVYWKAIYREYTDTTFTTLKQRPPQWQHLGILGPLIRAEVGDTIKVVFKNRTKLFCTIHPHGLEYGKKMEGAMYSDGTSGADKKGDMVHPGETYTYVWSVPERSGPGPGDPSSIIWMYHSHFVESRDINSGLIGPIIISRRGSTRPDGTPQDVDREFVTAFAIFDETESWFFEKNIMNLKDYSLDLSNLSSYTSLKAKDPAFRLRHLMYTINGLIEANLPNLTMKKGERVRWYLLSNDNEEDVHAAHWHGETVMLNNTRTDTVGLAPMAMTVADMMPDNVGTWLFHCHVNEHFHGGMVALFTVLP